MKYFRKECLILANRLRLLEHHNLIYKNTVETEKTLKVEYVLTDVGRELSKLLVGLCSFTELHTDSFKF